MSENALVARAFKPPWGKRKVPAFVSKAGTYYGDPGGIRTHSLSLRSFKKRSPLLFPEVPLRLAITGFLTIFTVRNFLQNTPVFSQCC